MKSLVMDAISRHSGIAKFGCTVVFLSLFASLAAAQAEKGARPAATPKVTSTPTSTAKPIASASGNAKVDATTEAELLQAEQRFREAIEKRDSDALDHLLMDYYTDGLEEGERALTKRAVLIQCEAGKLDPLTIDKPRITQTGDRTTVEGQSKMALKNRTTGQTEERAVHVRRFWTRKDGQWFVAGQLREFLDAKEKEEREKERQEKEPKPEKDAPTKQKE
jgi:hypothetical protein